MNQFENKYSLILASASPRRKNLLKRLGLNLLVKPAHINEEAYKLEDPAQLVQLLAEKKCEKIRKSNQDFTILGADTTVVYNNQIIGKPKSKKDALRIWSLLSNQTHDVISGYCLLNPDGRKIVRKVITRVCFKELSPEEMDAFLLTDNWKDKAGGYEIQGLNAFWVKEIQGSYTNVMGLPIAEVIEDLKFLHPTWNAFPWKE